MMEARQQVAGHKAGFLDTIKAVGASFFGVRGRRAHERDMARLDPARVVIAGLLAAAIFVLVLVALARLAAG
ncbi:MAG: DUF2970 domain-containing protein [Burkholderiaceae bacterium]|jgi:hypothetical protein|nr:DUF2970 domain-containing protein [Acidobacteriota bacterium]